MEGNKKWIALVVVVALIIGGIGGYMYYKRTPAYSLKLIEESVKEHNWEKFNRHVDVKEIADSAFDDLVAASMSEDTSVDSGMKTLAAGFIQMFKPMVVNALQDGIKEFVETGTRTGSKDDKQNKEQAKDDQGNQAADNLLKNTRAAETKFTGIKSTETEGSIATVTLGLHDEKLSADYEIKLRMNQLDDGTWRLAKISNLKEFYKSVQEAEKKKLDQLNAPIRSEIDNAVKIGDIAGVVQQKDSYGFSYELILSADAQINASKPLSGFSGDITVTNPSGEVTTIHYNYDFNGSTNGTQKIALSKELNPFIPGDSDMIKRRVQGYTFKASVTALKYQDGKIIELLSKLPET